MAAGQIFMTFEGLAKSNPLPQSQLMQAKIRKNAVNSRGDKIRIWERPGSLVC